MKQKFVYKLRAEKKHFPLFIQDFHVAVIKETTTQPVSDGTPPLSLVLPTTLQITLSEGPKQLGYVYAKQNLYTHM